ncbi:MAG: hypothetical protein HQ488_00665 [Parcubacteria group bacterium]|nr:hypothetical protein [Parcubacteria group bacterium]
MVGRKKKEGQASIAIVVAMVLFGSIFFFLSSAPEQLVAGSSDGVVQVTGLTRSAADVTIERLKDVQVGVDGVIGPAYELILDSGQLERGELTFFIDESVDVTEVVLYQFNRNTLTWLPLATNFDLTSGSVSAQIEFSGSTLVVPVSRVL